MFQEVNGAKHAPRRRKAGSVMASGPGRAADREPRRWGVSISSRSRSTMYSLYLLTSHGTPARGTAEVRRRRRSGHAPCCCQLRTRSIADMADSCTAAMHS